MGKCKFIIHFSPLELYPPVQNLIRVLENANVHQPILILTSKWSQSSLDEFESRKKHIEIKRLGKSGPGLSKMGRVVNYISFYGGCLFYLLARRPKVLLYFETLSSFPAYIYKKIINRESVILAHYHEYTSVSEYESGMLMVRWFHKFEMSIYPMLAWLSHTNNERLKLFIRDIAPVAFTNAQVVPNYPPAAWANSSTNVISSPLRLVYVGALSLDTMYTVQMAQWVHSHAGRVHWHIYSHNQTEEAAAYFKSLNSEHIKLFDGLNYEGLPALLRTYNVGVILYKGHIANYIYNAPNKLFEYVVCGLDVWYPSEMIGCHEYDSAGSPKIIRIDFKNLNLIDEDFDKEEVTSSGTARSYTAEEALEPLLNLFCK